MNSGLRLFVSALSGRCSTSWKGAEYATPAVFKGLHADNYALGILAATSETYIIV